ncbi:MAG: NAD-dependent epimerase/dehydratase family protein, partial [Acidobacteria bacterium]|nr:NAD-dependent epimerase/dehydratase family protein [Acidobacteriota bacterium]
MEHAILITGGAGFIGVNSARRFLARGWKVTLLDNFSRAHTDTNIAMLDTEYPGNFRIVRSDVSLDVESLEAEIQIHDVVLHLAAQVAVTTSLVDPRKDFQINAWGTFNVLEAIRKSPRRPFLIFSSTNKVYGALTQYSLLEDSSRYLFAQQELNQRGISEQEVLDFHSPYGCSKGCADQYVRDYARIYGLSTVVFRQSCIYGRYQFGVEDQGWIAWFAIAALSGQQITIYGDGKQVRDILHVDDLTRLYAAAIDRQDKVSGKVYNIGGGPYNTLSIRDFILFL